MRLLILRFLYLSDSGARGDSLDEARENAKDLVMMEIEQGRQNPGDTAIVETITFSVPLQK
ncbi:hypothetical protein ACT8ZS_07675 [Paenibacillus sp. M.A.Huq-84]